MKAFSIFILLLSLHAVSNVSAQTANKEYQLANKAYEVEDYKGFLTHLKNANELRPNHRVILYNLAVAYALNDEYTKAINTLRYRASFYAINDFSEDERFVELRKLNKYKELLSSIDATNEPDQTSTLHFEFEEPGFHTEGVSAHPTTGKFFLSDIRCGLIYSFDSNGTNKQPELDLKGLGFWGAMGMKFDPMDPNILWVTTSVLTNYCNYSEDLEGRSAVLKIDMKSKKVVESYSLEGNHIFGDLIVAENGTIYVTDSADPVIYRITEQSNELEKFFTSENIFNLQGLALGVDNILYFSDYITGVYSLNTLTKETNPVLSNNQLTRGTDGLYYHNNSLYLLQNGTRPFQVARIDLENQSLNSLDRATPELNEPTLGTVHDGYFYFIANSPWAFYDEEGKPIFNEWPTLQIRKIDIRK
jgi:tetratricopeptide (TPR) repeat protein